MGRNNLAAEFVHTIWRKNFRSRICSCDREERQMYLLLEEKISAGGFVPAIAEEQYPQRDLNLR